MKRFITCISFLLIIVAPSFAQQTNPSPALTSADYLKKSKNQKTAAWVLLVAGATILFFTQIDHTLESGLNPTKPPFPIVPVTIGSACILGGIPLLLAAARNKRKAIEGSANLIIQRVPSIQQASIGIQYFPAVSMKIYL